jgi:(2Fe-2S) ferredoxin
MSVKVLVCTNYRSAEFQASCARRGSVALRDALRDAAEPLGIAVEEIACFGRCADGPIVRIAPLGEFFSHVSDKDIPAIIANAQEESA